MIYFSFIDLIIAKGIKGTEDKSFLFKYLNRN